jgi:20S proteasome alpha/beta subunit
MELEDAIHIALQTLRETHSGRLEASGVEVGVIGTDPEGPYFGKFTMLTKAEIKDYLE